MPQLRPAAFAIGAGRFALNAGKRAVVGAVAVGGEVRRRLGDRVEPPLPSPTPTGPPSPRPDREVPEPDPAAKPRTAPDGVAVSGFPEPPGKDPGDISSSPSPHSALSNPVVDDPDLTAEVDPYEQQDGAPHSD